MPNRIAPVPTEGQLIDIHCHQQVSGHLHIVSLDTFECADFSAPRLDGLPSAGRYFSVGIHPWFIARQDVDAAMQRLAEIVRLPAVLAVGECGLDNCIETPLETQVDVFVRQIELAEAAGKPLLIHCVRAFHELLRLKKRYGATRPWIVHGFAGRPELARQLLQQGCYLSFGKALLNEHHQTGRALQAVPPDRLFLETDMADVEIGVIYREAAKILGFDLPTLQRRIVANFARVFTHD